jgi:hypothetical protein
MAPDLMGICTVSGFYIAGVSIKVTIFLGIALFFPYS